MKNWIALFLFAVVTKDLGPKCVDFMGEDHKAHTRCAEVVRYSVKGQPDCESQEKSDCAYLYDVADGLNLLDEQRHRDDAICKKCALALPKISPLFEFKEIVAVYALYPHHEVYLTDRHRKPKGNKWELLPIGFKGMRIYVRPDVKASA